MMHEPVPCAVEARGLTCVRTGAALRNLQVSLAARAFHVFTGADASRDLLLRVIGLLEPADSGEVFVAGQPTAILAEEARIEFRSRTIGYVFTAPFLLPSFTIIENVVMPMFKILGATPEDAQQKATEVLDFVGLRGREQECAGELSMAEQYSVALARALATGPEILLVEALDGQLTGADLQRFAGLLREACSQWGVTVIATASVGWQAEPADHLLQIAEGVLHFSDPAFRSA